jgi:hypothetical protein
VDVTGLVEGHEQLLPSIELDTIDNLAQPITCNLILLLGGSIRMEVRRGLVYPHQTMLDDVQIDGSSYAMVKVDMVHENSKDLKLEVPLDDTTLTMWDAITRRVQWRRTYVVVDPSAVASASTTASQPNTALAFIFFETRPSLSPIREEPRPSPIREEQRPSPMQEQLQKSPPRTRSIPLPAPDQTRPSSAMPKMTNATKGKQPQQRKMLSKATKAKQPLKQPTAMTQANPKLPPAMT